MSKAGIVFLTCILPCSFDPNVAAENRPNETRARRMREVKRYSNLDFSYLRNKEYLAYLVASSVVFSGITIPIVHLVSYE